MKLKKTKTDFYPLADMHTDGVRFDPSILAAKKQQQRTIPGEPDQQISIQ